MSAAQSLESYVAGNWSRGPGVESVLIDPTSGAILATVSAKGLDLAGALKFARQQQPRSPGSRLCRSRKITAQLRTY